MELTYADHEFVNFRLEAVDQADDNDRVFQEFKIEDDVLDLENDELGMLSWLRAGVSLSATAADPSELSLGGAETVVEIGSNLSGNEYLGENNNDRGVEVVRDSSSVFNIVRANDEPGLWALMNPSITTQSADDSSGTGTGADLGEDRMTRRFYQETGEGPYIDSTDDITVGILCQRGRTETAITTRVVCEMSFVVFEYENRRQQFAPLD